MLPAHCCSPGHVVVYVGLMFCFCLGIVVANLGLAFAVVLPCNGPCGFDVLFVHMHCCGQSGFDACTCLSMWWPMLV